MKRFVNPLPTDGIPYSNEDFLNLEGEIFTAFYSLLTGIGNAFVLSGCTPITLTSSNGVTIRDGISLGGTLLESTTISAGYVWLDGEVRYFPGYSGFAPFYIKSDIETYTKKKVRNTQALKDVYVTKKAIGTPSKPTTGQYITCTPEPNLVFKNIITADVRNALTVEIQTRQTQITDEITARTSADTILNQRLATLSDLTNTKVTKKITGTGWIDIPLETGFSTDTVPGFHRAQMMRTENGFVHLRGRIDFTSNANTTSPFSILPAGFSTNIYQSTFTINSLAGQFILQVCVTASGIYALPYNLPSSALRAFALDGINFYADGVGGVI